MESLKDGSTIIVNSRVCYYIDGFDVRLFRHNADGKPREAICDINTYPVQPEELLGKVFKIFG